MQVMWWLSLLLFMGGLLIASPGVLPAGTWSPALHKVDLRQRISAAVLGHTMPVTPVLRKTAVVRQNDRGQSYFQPYPVRFQPVSRLAPVPVRISATQRNCITDQIRRLIASAEAGHLGYDAVQYGAEILPGAAPTAMTIAQINDWVGATPGQPHAIGRYQFIPPTLRRLVAVLGLSPETRFTPSVQDALADVLLAEAGLQAVKSGHMPPHRFMNNLAKIWAGLPNDTGHSHYDGYAGNHATITWTQFDQKMQAILASAKR